MAATPKPLTIIALEPVSGWPELDKLEAQGHYIVRVRREDGDNKMVTVGALAEADIIIGKNCWRFTEHHQKYLAVALKEARLLRYPSKEARADKKNRKSAEKEIEPDAN